MYHFTIKDKQTRNGWQLKSDRDIVLYLTGLPYFATVHTLFIEEALEQIRGEFENVDELADYIAENLI